MSNGDHHIMSNGDYNIMSNGDHIITLTLSGSNDKYSSGDIHASYDSVASQYIIF